MSSIHLLIVDDEEIFLEATAKALKRRAIEAHTATNGVDAMQMLRQHPIDVVVLDVKMPGLDGVDVLTKIKTKYPLIEVIMLTGHASIDLAVKGLKLGAFDFLTKPCSIENIVGRVQAAFDKKQAVEEKNRQTKVQRIISHPMAVFEKDE
jgi:DNA-binding NtrC family response regulator